MTLLQGLPLNGKQLQRVPADASREDQISIINNIIDQLNSVDKDVVGSGSTTLSLDGSQLTQVYVIPHGLGYKPRAVVYMNNVTITIGSTLYQNVDFPLPTYLIADGIGVGGGGGKPTVNFEDWLDFFTDAQNLYIHHNNIGSITLQLPVSYFFMREPTS